MIININEDSKSFTINFDKKKNNFQAKADYVAILTGVDMKYDFKRIFLNTKEPIFLTYNAIYEASEKVHDKYAFDSVKDVRKYFKIINNAIHILTKTEVNKAFSVKEERIQKFNLLNTEFQYSKEKINALNALQKMCIQHDINIDYSKSFYLFNAAEIKALFSSLLREDKEVFKNVKISLNSFCTKLWALQERINAHTKKEKTLKHE